MNAPRVPGRDAARESLPLQQGIVYGPVQSRRFGRSLGLNILPDEIKVCSLNCRYCQYSWTGLLSIHPDMYAAYLPSREAIRAALESKLVPMEKASAPPDSITFSGNGEATLHPDFPSIAADVSQLRDRYARGCKTVILSNGTTVHREEIRDALCLLDEPVLKLDSGLEETFRRLNGPAPTVRFDRIVEGLKAMGSRAILQSLFVCGSVDNTTDEDLARWIEIVGEIHPKRVQIYTLDRAPADGGLYPVPAIKLEAIAAAVLERAGVAAQVFQG